MSLALQSILFFDLSPNVTSMRLIDAPFIIAIYLHTYKKRHVLALLYTAKATHILWEVNEHIHISVLVIHAWPTCLSTYRSTYLTYLPTYLSTYPQNSQTDRGIITHKHMALRTEYSPYKDLTINAIWSTPPSPPSLVAIAQASGGSIKGFTAAFITAGTDASYNTGRGVCVCR